MVNNSRKEPSSTWQTASRHLFLIQIRSESSRYTADAVSVESSYAATRREKHATQLLMHEMQETSSVESDDCTGVAKYMKSS
mmetsp:Transcript_16359/g.45203  ORF Transcript_16359/g.45203 Transcript_16359/m.45203 type:complete len:82 (+) Transcript_16359:224-469(+)